MEKRLKHAKLCKRWTETQIQQVLWSDKSRFEVSGSNSGQYVQRRSGERYSSEYVFIHHALPFGKHLIGNISRE